MKIKFFVTLFLLIVTTGNAFTQVVRPSVQPPREPLPVKREFPTMPDPQNANDDKRFKDDADDIVRVDTKLVQIDAVVLDKNGKLVPGLKADDFQVLQDGKPQKVDFFSYIESGSERYNGQNGEAKSTPSTRASFGVEKLKRTIAFVVDDTCMGFGSVNTVQRALLDFVTKQMQEGDLVGIFRTRSGNGMLQQFSGDKNLLLKGIKNISSAQSFGCQDEFGPARADYTIKQGQGGSATFQNDAGAKAQARINSLRRESLSLGTVKTIEYLTRGMQVIPGRKSLILLSDGLFTGDQGSNQTAVAIRRLVNFANQSSVVVYTMNTRGVFDSTFISAQDEVLPSTGDGGGGNDIEKLVTQRTDLYRSGVDGLRYLAYSTGGTFVNNSNDLNKGFNRILEDQSGYYLIGYQPDESTLKLDSNFRKLSVRTMRPELTVRHRFGFYGVINSKAASKPKNADTELFKALISPLSVNNLRLKFTPFIETQGKNSVVRYVIHIDANDVTFSEQSPGALKLGLDIVAVMFGPDGKLIEEFNRTNNAVIKGGSLQQLMQNGLSYTGAFMLKKPGVYQIRAAVRDIVTRKIGTVSQFFEAPEPGKNAFSLSPIIISGESEPFPPVIPPNRKLEESLSFPRASTEPSIRRFAAGKGLGFGYTIYSPAIDSALRKPNLTSQFNIYQDGKLLYKINESPVDTSSYGGTGEIRDSGVVPLRADMQPGVYILEIIVKDLNRNNKTTSQSIDFEVVR